MKGLAVCLPGGFSGMPAHMGALHEWFTAADEKGFPRPEYICTSSAGGIAGSISLQDAEARKKAQLLMISLRKKDFARLNPEIKNRGIVTIASTLGVLIPAQLIKKPLARFVVTLGATGAAFVAQKEFVKSLFHAESFLTYDKLYNLLMETLNFDQIFNSPIKIEVSCVNLNKAGWTLDEILSNPPRYLDGWENKGWVSVTNFRPEDTDLPLLERNHNFGAGIVHGARIWALFRPGRTPEGHALVDTAALNNVPFNKAINRGYNKIVVLYYNRSVEAPSEEPFDTWVKCLNRSMDITVSEKTRTSILGSLRMNNDLEQLDKHRRAMDELRSFLGYYPNGHWPKLEEALRLGDEASKGYSFSNKRKIDFLFVRSRPLPNIHLGGFTQDDIITCINHGAEAMRNAMPEIERLYNK